MKNNIVIIACVFVSSLVMTIPALAEGQPKLLAEFTTAAGGDPILLPVTMKGKTYKFLLDTGANRTTFDKKLEPLLGEPKQSFKAEMEDGQEHVMNIYYAPNATVGPLSMETAGAVFCVDLTNLREATGQNVDGVLGNTFLRKYAVQIDFDNGKVRFYEDTPNTDKTSFGQPAAMQLLPSGVPVVVAELAGNVKNVMLVDTGFGQTGILPAKLFDHLQKEKKLLASTSTQIDQKAENHKYTVGRTDTVRLGDNRYTNLVFDRSDIEMSLLGLNFLSRHTITLDYPNRILYLKKGKRYDQPDEIDMSGMQLLGQNNNVVVDVVDKGSPAEKAGIQPGDILRRVNHQNTQTMPLSDLRRLLRSGEGKSLEIILQRGDKGFKTTLKLKKQI